MISLPTMDIEPRKLFRCANPSIPTKPIANAMGNRISTKANTAANPTNASVTGRILP